MPRKGPPKSTRREERATEKQAAMKERQREEAKRERAAQAVREYRSNAEIPQSQAQQRDLRRGLNEEGLVYERYGEAPSQLLKRGEIMEKSSGGRMVPRGFESWEDQEAWDRVEMIFWVCLSFMLQLAWALKVLVANDSAYGIRLAQFNMSKSLYADAFQLELTVTLPWYPLAIGNASLLLRVCPNASLSNYSTYLTSPSNLLAYDSTFCIGSRPFRRLCQSYNLLPRYAHQHTEELQIFGEFNTDIDAMQYILLLDLCTLYSTTDSWMPVVSGALEFNICKATELCFKDGSTFELTVVYFIMATLWGALVLIWFGHIIYHRNRFTTMQQKMLVVPLAECLYLSLVYTALADSQKMSSALKSFIMCCRILSLGASAYELLLITHGWKITRDDLRLQHFIQYCLLSLCCSVPLAIIQFSSDPSFFISSLFLLSAAIIICVVLYNIDHNVSILRHHMRLLSTTYIIPTTTPVYTKLCFFRAFAKFLVFYFAVLITFEIIISEYLALDLANITPIVFETLYMVFCIGVGYTFRCRQFNPIFYVTFPPDNQTIAPTQELVSDRTTIQPWQPGMDLPVMQALQSPRRNVIIQSPADNTGLGTATVALKQNGSDFGSRNFSCSH